MKNKYRLSKCENVRLRNVLRGDDEHTCDVWYNIVPVNMVDNTPTALKSLDFQQSCQRSLNPQPRAQQKHYSPNQPRIRVYSFLQHKPSTRQTTPHQHQHPPQQHQDTYKHTCSKLSGKCATIYTSHTNSKYIYPSTVYNGH